MSAREKGMAQIFENKLIIVPCREASKPSISLLISAIGGIIVSVETMSAAKAEPLRRGTVAMRRARMPARVRR